MRYHHQAAAAGTGSGRSILGYYSANMKAIEMAVIPPKYPLHDLVERSQMRGCWHRDQPYACLSRPGAMDTAIVSDGTAHGKGVAPGEPPDGGVAMRGNRMGMSNTHRFTAPSYDSFPASEWASPRFVMVCCQRTGKQHVIFGLRVMMGWVANGATITLMYITAAISVSGGGWSNCANFISSGQQRHRIAATRRNPGTIPETNVEHTPCT
jgi:hypothetical protein